MSDQDFPRQEKTRICPSCRMQISVLATKCRFCGEEVGKPKDETRTLSIHDLGGEQVYHRAPSGSVLEAMEAFRADETMREASEKEGGGGLNDLGIGESEEASGTGISFDHEPSSIFSPSHYAASSSGLAGRFKLAGAVVAVLILLVVGVTMGPRILESLDQSEAEAEPPVFRNRAPEVLAAGGPAIDALELAVKAIDREDSAKNRRIAEDAVAAVEKEVTGLLNATPFEMENLQEASAISAQAASLYPNQTTRNLADVVRDEYRDYTMTLLEIKKDAEDGTRLARFQLNKGDYPIVEVKRSDTLDDRFRVRSFVGSQRVILLDIKRGNRPVVYDKGRLPMSPG